MRFIWSVVVAGLVGCGGREASSSLVSNLADPVPTSGYCLQLGACHEADPWTCTGSALPRSDASCGAPVAYQCGDGDGGVDQAAYCCAAGMAPTVSAQDFCLQHGTAMTRP